MDNSSFSGRTNDSHGSRINTTTHPLRDDQHFRSMISGIAFIPIGLVGTTGSVLCLYAIFSLRKAGVKTTIDLIFINLSIIVLIFSLFCCPINAYSTLAGYPNFLSSSARYYYLCQAVAFLNYTVISTDVLMHASIAIHRFITVVVTDRPAFSWLKSRLSIIMLAFAPWVVGLVEFGPPLFHVGGEYGYIGYTDRCGITLMYSFGYYRFLVTFALFLTLPVSLLCYLAILKKILDSRGKIKPNPHRRTTRSTLVKREGQVTTTAFVLCVVFVICYLPNTIFVLSPKTSRSDVDSLVGNTLVILLEIGCVSSPWVILLLTPQLRTTVATGPSLRRIQPGASGNQISRISRLHTASS